jgi:hypothetical protein
VTTDELCGYDAGRDGAQYAAYTRHAFEVENPDLSSVYSWQVRSPDGAWSAPQHGRRFEFTAWQPGQYRLRWRQENLLIRPGGFYETVRTFDNFPCCEPPAERP